MQTCQCCGQIIPPKDPFANCPIKKKIYGYVAKHPAGVTTQQIVAEIYSDAVDGGAESRNVIAVHVAGMNRILKRDGAKIKSTRGPGARYRLERRSTPFKLSIKSVRELRGLHGKYSHRKLARMFGISYSTVGQILRREKWAKV